MPMIPDDHSQRHDPPGTLDPAAITLSGLREQYPGWEILIHLDSSIVSAEHRSADGRAVRYIVASGVAELAGKLETAEVVEP